MAIFLITLSVFILAVAVMSIGVIFQNKHLRGSCGGPGIVGPDGEILSCDTCPNKDSDKCERDKTE